MMDEHDFDSLQDRKYEPNELTQPKERVTSNILPEHLVPLLPDSDSTLGVEQIKQVKNLLTEYPDTFVGSNGKLGHTNIAQLILEIIGQYVYLLDVYLKRKLRRQTRKQIKC